MLCNSHINTLFQFEKWQAKYFRSSSEQKLNSAIVLALMKGWWKRFAYHHRSSLGDAQKRNFCTIAARIFITNIIKLKILFIYLNALISRYHSNLSYAHTIDCYIKYAFGLAHVSEPQGRRSVLRGSLVFCSTRNCFYSRCKITESMRSSQPSTSS